MQNSIFLIPVNKKQLYTNFLKTVQTQVNVKTLTKFKIPLKIKHLQKISIWGLNNTYENKKLWKKMKMGDIILFLKDKKYFQMGRIVDTFQNSDIPQKFWLGDIFGKNRTLLIFINKIESINLDFDSTIPIFVKPTMPESYRFPIIQVDSKRQKMIFKIFGTIEAAIEFLSGKYEDSLNFPIKETEIELRNSLKKLRKGQDLFRKNVLNNFNSKCAICKISEKDLLEASHIIPVNKKNISGSIKNGICFCSLHHLMFDKGYFSFDDKYHVIIDDQRFSSEILLNDMKKYDKMSIPRIPPSLDFLKLHNARFGLG